MRWTQPQTKQKDGLLTNTPLSSPYQKDSAPAPSSSSSKISPAVLFIIVILAVIFFVSGLLHLLVRYFMKKRSSSTHPNRQREMSGSDDFQRQLQQLFQLHDSGLDQAFIDALPVFQYKEILGLKEPFDCAVCLCEFSHQDKLRLLPLCSHAFHIDCIDTWLLSNSTCPLCRGTLFTPGFSIENPVFDFDDSVDEDGFSGSIRIGVSCGKKQAEDDIVGEKKVFPVRLGKFRSTHVGGTGERQVGETSNSNLDARRCYSMGSFQYVVANSDLQVELCPNKGNSSNSVNSARLVKGRFGLNGNSSVEGDSDGKSINTRSKGESFSVSKIWLWPRKGKAPSSSGTPMVTSSDDEVHWVGEQTSFLVISMRSPLEGLDLWYKMVGSVKSGVKDSCDDEEGVIICER
ncbi:hypothetical protein RJ639_000277 [Escallonia herrerae]|uniref:RING-type E3 ubiquitin transferase n=1 Tax=Escallonia herrerae TaxID=1293975 RepID=A0AA89BRX6_9ASTE|nr:hypothetical protein RJ639_000277 [Escallonia herrerae]